MLNSMASREFESALERHVEWGVRVLDLKDCIFGKSIVDLTDEEAERASELARECGLSVHCLSTVLFHPEIELGEAAFRKGQLAPVARAVEIADIMGPSVVRLLAAQTTRRPGLADSVEYIRREHPWVIPVYREAIDRLNDAGYAVTIENEIGRCILATPQEVRGFFAMLDRQGKVSFTWDVQNMWQMGTFPTTDVYLELRDLIGYFHLKGGQHDGKSTALRWASALKDASWPVIEITRRAVADGVSPVICLNPSHGQAKSGYDYGDVLKRDIEFLRGNIPGIE
jgi:hypothetical protein